MGYTGNQCGQFTLTSFSNNLNVYLKADGTAGTAPFSSGTFTAPVAGWYHICSFSRFKNSGNSNDVTILTGGLTVIGGYGSAVTYDWRSTSFTFFQPSLQVEGDHPRVAVTLGFHKFMLGMTWKARMTNCLDTWVSLQPLSNYQGVPLVFLHPHSQCLQGPVHQVAVERTWHRTNGILKES